jgi:hypothetical protein
VPEKISADLLGTKTFNDRILALRYWLPVSVILLGATSNMLPQAIQLVQGIPADVAAHTTFRSSTEQWSHLLWAIGLFGAMAVTYHRAALEKRIKGQIKSQYPQDLASFKLKVMEHNQTYKIVVICVVIAIAITFFPGERSWPYAKLWRNSWTFYPLSIAVLSVVYTLGIHSLLQTLALYRWLRGFSRGRNHSWHERHPKNGDTLHQLISKSHVLTAIFAATFMVYLAGSLIVIDRDWEQHWSEQKCEQREEFKSLSQPLDKEFEFINASAVNGAQDKTCLTAAHMLKEQRAYFWKILVLYITNALAVIVGPLIDHTSYLRRTKRNDINEHASKLEQSQSRRNVEESEITSSYAMYKFLSENRPVIPLLKAHVPLVAFVQSVLFAFFIRYSVLYARDSGFPGLN